MERPPAIVLEARTVRRLQVKNTSQRNRAGSLSASDFNSLAKIDATIRDIQMRIMADRSQLEVGMDWMQQLLFIREQITMPMEIYVHIYSAGKNRRIAALEFGDDEIFVLFRAHRAQLQQLYSSLRAPELLQLSAERSGYCDSEFAFIAWLYKTSKTTTYVECQSRFNMEWSRISKCVSAFQKWFFDAHSFRVTNSLHFWAPSVIRFGEWSFCCVLLLIFLGCLPMLTRAAVGTAFS